MRNSFELALDHLGRKMGGKPVEVIYEDDGQKPDVGKQKTEKLVAVRQGRFHRRLYLVERAAGLAQDRGRLADLPDLGQCRAVADRRRTVLAVRLLDLLAERPDAAGDGRLHEPEGRQVGVPDRPELRRRQGHAGGRARARSRARSWARNIRSGRPARLLGRADQGARRQARGIFVFYPGAAGVQFLKQ